MGESVTADLGKFRFAVKALRDSFYVWHWKNVDEKFLVYMIDVRLGEINQMYTTGVYILLINRIMAKN